MKSPKKPYKNFIVYTGLAIQMAVAIAVFTWLGVYLDERLENEGRLWTIVFSLIGVFAGLYLALKDFIGNKEE